MSHTTIDSDRVTAPVRFEPEPPLREGQFLATSVLQRSQIVRTLVVLAILCLVVVLLGTHTNANAAENGSRPLAKAAKTQQIQLAARSRKKNQRGSARSSKRSASKSDAAFRKYIADLWPQARAIGVSRTVFDQAFAGVRLDPAVLRPARAQSEFVKPIWSYLASSVSPKRISQGRDHSRRWESTLANIESRYGVDRYVVLAIWGMETSYGGFTGNQNVIRALASLSFAGVREEFFRKELLTALLILQQGHISRSRMTGSWAGAMGQTQFMPSSFVKYAVDHNGDGRKNIWTDVPDALASTANYLAKFGWQRGMTWGYEVILPGNFDFAAHDPRQSRPFTYWNSIGLRRADSRRMPTSGSAAIMLPAGRRGPAFLMTVNFKVIKEYNRSNAYALGVAHLSDRIAGMGQLKASWPRKDRALSKSQVMYMQRYLNSRGYKAGKVDGRIGENVTAAVRAFQIKRGLVADGYPNYGLYQLMRKSR